MSNLPPVPEDAPQVVKDLRGVIDLLGIVPVIEIDSTGPKTEEAEFSIVKPLRLSEQALFLDEKEMRLE